MYASFRRVRGLGYMTVPEMLETMHENDLFDIFPVFSNVVHILGVLPATLCSAERSFSALCRFGKRILPQHHQQQCVSNIALINTETPDRIIDIFGRQNGKDSYFF